MNILIDNLQEFPCRLKNALKFAGINFTRDFEKINMRDLSYIYGIGAKGRASVIDFCKKNGTDLNKRQGPGLQRKIDTNTGKFFLAVTPVSSDMEIINNLLNQKKFITAQDNGG
jgi:hypothetical protein